MRQWTAVLVAALAGCGGGQAPSASRTSGGISTNFVCPDKNCTHNNGTGIYYAENGFAGIGDSQLMITHFRNTGTGVTFQGRYRDARSGRWATLARPGTVDWAEYDGQVLSVRSVTEVNTAPQWTLQAQGLKTVARPQLAPATSPAPQGPVPTTSKPSSIKLGRLPGVVLNLPPARIISVSGAELGKLKLHISFWTGPDERRRYALDFAGELTVPLTASPPRQVRRPVTLGMRWRLDSASAPPPTPYCWGAQKSLDGVVFQRGITVDPMDGVVEPAPAAVTLSCGLGAPAKVYGWGYDYDPAKIEAFYFFRAGIHLKRASYCGDSEFYTVTGTRLLVGDSLRINQDLPAWQVPARGLEAWWTPEGASCLNADAVRQPAIVHQKGFQGVCGTKKLPTCELPPPSDGATARYLISAPVRQ